MSDAELDKRAAYISELKNAILRLHGCESKYAGSEEVIETFQGETVWNGTVEIFNIRGHPKAKRAYAWAHATGQNDQARRYVAVLELPPVNSPQTAVRAAVVSEIKDARKNQT
ncbi:MAG TPA: hypothetical protein VJT50_16465 [Pyrinomonadaceae bacterium]|nr:hypothetical protein [Pyrinomonadaceae bacterium]